MPNELIDQFEKFGINYNAPGFYNENGFIRQERDDTGFLQTYGYYVCKKQYDENYFRMVRQKLPIILSILNEEIKANGRLGACVDVSQALNKMLEAEKIWSVMVEGAFNAEYSDSDITEKYLWNFEDTNNIYTRNMPGHVWIHCPPFVVVDSTIKYQPYTQHQDKYLPDFVLQEQVTDTRPSLEDICSPEVYEIIIERRIKEKDFLSRSGVSQTLKHLKASYFRHEKIYLKYIPCKFTASDATDLESINSLILSGKKISEIYMESIKPALESLS